MDGRSEKLFETHKEAILAEAASRYDIDSSTLKRLGSFESVVYEYENGGRGCILKITHSLHRTPELVRGELDWTKYLIDNGVSVSRTVPSKSGNMTEVIDGKSITELEDDYFIIYALEKSPGRLTTPDDWSDEFINKWGRIVGRMNALAKTFVPTKPSWKRFEWHEDDSLRVDRHIPSSQPKVVEKCNSLIKRMLAWPTDHDSYGMIHSDMHHSNFVTNDGRITAFDFDDCHYGWFGFDIMIPLFYVMRDHRIDPDDTDFARRFFSEFITGYRQENIIDGMSIKRIPEFMKLRELDLYSVIYSEGIEEEEGWCKRFMENRRQRIENGIPVVDIDFSTFM